MQLRAWIQTQGLSFDQAAKRLDLPTATSVWRYALGRTIPRPATMRKICEATGMAVTPADFYATSRWTAIDGTLPRATGEREP
jgi:transcriptional regulator with XRE-family HTH domain